MTQSKKRVLIFLLSLDIILTILHILFGRQNFFFHLDIEHNLPTYYQGFKLIIFGIIFLVWFFKRKSNEKMPLFSLPFSLGMIFIGIDEVFEIHENIYRVFELTNFFHPERVIEATLDAGYRSSIWIIYYLPIIFTALIWLGYFLRHFQEKSKAVFKLLILSCFLVFIVFLMEILSSSGLFSDETYFWMITVEETAEAIFGTALVAIGLLTLGKTVANKEIVF
jgi:hypothetical protein